MTTGRSRVTFVVHVGTTGTRKALFPAAEPVDAVAEARLRTVERVRADRFRHAPDPASAATCAAVGERGTPDAGVRCWDAGRWAGRSLDAVAAEDPDGVTAWLTDPAAAPHGGESLLALIERVGNWLDAVDPGHTVAVCGPAVVRAAVVGVLGAPAPGFWRLDAPPLTVTDLRGGPDRWTVRAAGAGRSSRQV